MSNSSNKETLNVIFKGSGFYITDSRNTSHIDIPSDTSELAHLASCSCAACASASSHEHPVSHSDHDHKHDDGHDQSVEVSAIQQGDHAKEEHPTEIPVVAELPTERKYLPLNQIGAEALSIGQFLPIVELVHVQHGSTTVLQGRVGILYKTVTGKRAARTMRHTIPLEVFDSIQELQADLQTKIQQNRGLTDALGAIGSMFGGCGHLLHFYGAEGLGGHVHGMAGSSSARSSTENSFFPSSPLNSSIQRAWAQSGGDIFIFEKLLMSFLPQIRLFLDSVVTVSSGLIMVGPKNSISLNQALPFAA